MSDDHWADEPTGPHRYTVDVYLHAHESYPCILCGRLRNDPIHAVEKEDGSPWQ